MNTIFSEISAERARQQENHSAASDDGNTVRDWVAIITKHLGRSLDDGTHCKIHDPTRFRVQMVRVAAIAVAAIETCDRRTTPAVPTPLATPVPPVLPDWWQNAADALGYPVLIIGHRNPSLFAEGPSCPYAVAEATADTWERSNFVARVAPRTSSPDVLQAPS